MGVRMPLTNSTCGLKTEIVICNLIVAAIQIKQNQLADIFRRFDLWAQAVVMLLGSITRTYCDFRF